MTRTLAALAITAALSLVNTQPAPAAPIARDAGRPDFISDHPAAHRVALVSLDLGALTQARSPNATHQDTLEFELFAQPAPLNIERVLRRSNDATTIIAHVADHPDSRAVITIYADAVSARIEHPELGAFVIEPTGMRTPDGQRIHQLIEVDPAAFLPCAVDDAAQPFIPTGPAPRGITVVDQMIVYTPAIRNTLGGHDAAFAFCQNAVDITNQAYLDSEITNLVINLVHAQEVSYTESGNTGTDLSRLRSASDGLIDEIHSVRNAVAADNVAMIVNTASNACGTGYLNPASANSAFSVSVRSCAIGNLTFPHELGHTMGCAHDRAAANSGWFPYSFGRVFTTSAGALRRTILATSSGTRIARFSNPDVLYLGTPTGVPIGDPQAAHNAETHRLTASLMAAHRTSLGCAAFAITADPTDAQACVGEPASLSVDTIESAPGSVTYQWRRDAQPIAGADEPTLNIAAAAPADSAIYDCVVSNDCISITSQAALLSVVNPEFTLNPQSQTAATGQTVVLTAAFPGTPSLIFWEKDGEIILNALGSTTLTLEDVTQDDAGVYTCNVIIDCGTIASEPATLTISTAGCSLADLSEPFGVLDFSDVLAFLTAFAAEDPAADVSPPLGVFDFSDVLGFITDFAAGCP